jgi:hypothetical protein
MFLDSVASDTLKQIRSWAAQTQGLRVLTPLDARALDYICVFVCIIVLYLFESRVLRISGPKRDDVTEDLKLQYEDLRK